MGTGAHAANSDSSCRYEQVRLYDSDFVKTKALMRASVSDAARALTIAVAANPRRYRAGRRSVGVFGKSTPFDRVWTGLERADTCFSGVHCWDKLPARLTAVFGCEAGNCPHKAVVVFDKGKPIAFATTTIVESETSADEDIWRSKLDGAFAVAGKLAVFAEGKESNDVNHVVAAWYALERFAYSRPQLIKGDVAGLPPVDVHFVICK